MTAVLRLTDPQSLADLGRFASRARTVDDEGAMRLQASGEVLAAWVGVLPGNGILAEGTVLGLRTFALAEPAELDVIVPLGAVTDRTDAWCRNRPARPADPGRGVVVGGHPTARAVGARRGAPR